MSELAKCQKMMIIFGFLTFANSRTLDIFRESNTVGPIDVVGAKTSNLERDYSTQNLESIVDQIANEFDIERDRVQNYFQRSKWASLSKQLFNKIDFNLATLNKRRVALSGTVIKITKANGIFSVNCRKAKVESHLLVKYRYVEKPYDSRYYLVNAGEPFSGEIIQNIYNDLNSRIEGQLNAYKAI